MALNDDFSRGLIQKSTYIRLALTTPRYDFGESYDVQMPLPGATLTEVLSEAALLVRDELVDIAIAPFTITWAEPQLLPTFSPTAVQTMKIGGKGYLYFALGADNPFKSSTQQVTPTRLYNFYGMSRSDVLAELSRLLDSKTATVNISALSIRWLNKSVPAAREFGSISDVVVQLRKEISEAIAKIPVPTSGAGVNHTHSLSQIEQLTIELNSKTSEDEFNSALAKRDEVLAQLTNWIGEKQSAFIINAADYGAIGDLVYREVSYEKVAIASGTDTTDKIQAALNAAATLVHQDIALEYEGRAICFIPTGKYIIKRSLIIPPNVVLHCEGVLFNFLESNEPIIIGSRHSHCLRVKVHANGRNGITWGVQGNSSACASDLGHIEVWHVGVGYDEQLPAYQQLAGLRLHGLDFRVDRFWVKGGNVGLDLYQASDILCNSAFLIGCSTGMRLESVEQADFPSVRCDTCIQTAIQIDNSTNARIDAIAFVNSDNYGTPMQDGVVIGRYSGQPCRSIDVKYSAICTGGYALNLQNAKDCQFEISASNSGLFSQTSANNTAVSHWNPVNWLPPGSNQQTGGGLKVHEVGVNYHPYGNEGLPAGVVKYGANLSGYLDVNLICEDAIARVEGTSYGTLLINGNKYGAETQSLRSILRVNCGGLEYSESEKLWIADGSFVIGGGGTASPDSVSEFSELIKSIRWGLDGYDIPLNPGIYTLKLWFIEPENRFRKFHINIQGETWQSEFCIYDEAGMSNLLIKSFVNVRVTDTLTIRFVPTAADAIITALEIFQ